METNYAAYLRKSAAEAERNRPKLRKSYRRYRLNPDAFNTEILKRKPYWSRQREIARAWADPSIRVILCPAGNGVGKSFEGAGLALWSFKAFEDTKVITTGPTYAQLERILWGNIFAAYNGSELAGQDRVLTSDLLIEEHAEHFVTGINPDNIEAASGYHGNVHAIVDESSALTASKDEAIASWNCRKRLYIGNPLRPDGPFYDKCQRQTLEPDPAVCLIKIPALESPSIVAGIRECPNGFSDLNWLDDMRREYGENSLWWKSHVLAEFPDSAEGQLIPRNWLDRCINAKWPSDDDDRTERTLSIDLGAGRGGDRSVVLVRSARRLLHLESSNQWALDDTARKAAEAAKRFGVRPARVIYDRSGLGEGFGKYLESAGVHGAIGFLGGSAAKGQERKFENLKSVSAWRLRQRLDPDTNPDPFAIPAEFGTAMRPELQAFTYEVTAKDKIKLTDKETVSARLGRSPDLADCLVMSFVALDKT